ncbi:aspartate 1-decarboxylase [Helicobacter sp. 11S02596-1]|uniref:aspartate 1-decarboxylase n=1 Tax=Helicobacter sp. 11S02596-1 TaxID=1476194 RepID=UPI000BA6BB02|nr:aspartate 1-decarboxylase [Helicobacter sp. 11S02596-1]PAF41768.1 aspartate 1-decarboxylase [Helicobacter sp. 11S02596-1]
MRFEMLYSKIHRAKVTDANLNYIGSITIDSSLARAAGLLEGMKVEILDVNNGERFSTYVILGHPDSGQICLNGAAARKVQIGDTIIIVAYGSYEKSELQDYAPIVVMVDDNNKILSTKKEV